MLHPSYSDLMKVVNSEVEPGEAPVVNSRYSIVMATSKRARQIIGGEEPMVKAAGKKPLSVALEYEKKEKKQIEELNQSKIRILGEEEAEALRQQVLLGEDVSAGMQEHAGTETEDEGEEEAGKEAGNGTDSKNGEETEDTENEMGDAAAEEA